MITNGSARSRAAVFLMWAGRLLLAVSAVVVVVCAVAYPHWVTPGDAPWTWNSLLPNIAVAAILILGMFIPLFLLPVSSGALVIADAGILKAQTVLGTRTISAQGIRTIAIFPVPGWPYDWYITVAAANIFKFVVIVDSGFWDEDSNSVDVASIARVPVRRRGRIFGACVLVAWIAVSMILTALLAVVTLHVRL